MASRAVRPSGMKLTTVTVALMAGVCLATATEASVVDIAFKDFVATSDLIVLARVSRIEAGPVIPNFDNGLGPRVLKVATAEVIETWKGKPVREVRYIASGTWRCDMSSAVLRERVVLFLEKGDVLGRNEPKFLSIAHVGRGRMPLHAIGGKTYAEIEDEVILPGGTPVISKERTIHLRLPAARPGEAVREYEIPYEVRSIELATFRKLVAREVFLGFPLYSEFVVPFGCVFRMAP